jgi:DNA-binding transcriptional LysR family regulator
VEGQLGGSLLERREGMRPTETGAVLLRHAQRLFAAERNAEEELRALRGLTRGELRLGASTTVATYMLPPLLGAFHAAHPQIKIRLTSENTRQIADRLLAREVDFAVVEGPGALKAVEMPGLAISRPLYRLRVKGRPLAPAAAEFERMLLGGRRS